MDVFIALIQLCILIALIVGLVDPRIVLGFSKIKTRGRVLLIYGLGLFVLPITSSLLSSSVPQQPNPNQKTVSINNYQYSISAPNTPPPQPTYLDISFQEYSKPFLPTSDWTEMQKDELFNSTYKGKYIKWKGRVEDVDKGEIRGLNIMVKHLSSTFTYDVSLDLKPEEEYKALKLKKGQTIIYSGKLTSWGEVLPHSVEDGVIVEVQ